MAIAHLDGDQLSAAVLNLINNVSPHTYGYEATTAVITEFLLPLTSPGLKREHIKTLLELAETWMELDEEAHSPWARMEQKSGSYRRHSAKALQKLRVAAMAICEGGTP